LVLFYVNAGTVSAATTLINDIVAGFSLGSKPRGYSNPTQLSQWDYQPTIIDMRDGVLGRPDPPVGYPYQNSQLYPRRPVGESGYWTLDYATLFEQGYAQYYNFVDPANPSRYLTLCELINSGKINELWMLGSANVPDVNGAEVLEHKQIYDATTKIKSVGNFASCAGNGCFDPDVPKCQRSVRIGWVNFYRGSGAYLHSHGHGTEGISTSNALQQMTKWFKPFARFDMNTAFSIPMSSMYGLACNGGGICATIFHSVPKTDITFIHGATNYVKTNVDMRCGNVHFPPNGVQHYDYANTGNVWSSCTNYGRGGALALVNSSHWSFYQSQIGSTIQDSGGDFLIWWFQNMPWWGSNQVNTDGTPMLSIGPYWFY
jgi:hypothetical protein